MQQAVAEDMDPRFKAARTWGKVALIVGAVATGCTAVAFATAEVPEDLARALVTGIAVLILGGGYSILWAIGRQQHAAGHGDISELQATVLRLADEVAAMREQLAVLAGDNVVALDSVRAMASLNGHLPTTVK